MPLSIADAIYWIAVASCAVAQLAILHSIVVSPARPVAAGAAPAKQRAIEIFWAVVPGLALAALFVFTWRAIHPDAASAAASAAASVLQ